jgi:hypothetical protein
MVLALAVVGEVARLGRGGVPDHLGQVGARGSVCFSPLTSSTVFRLTVRAWAASQSLVAVAAEVTVSAPRLWISMSSPSPPVERVVAQTAEEHVVTGAAEQHVVAIAAGIARKQPVIAGSAPDRQRLGAR